MCTRYDVLLKKGFVVIYAVCREICFDVIYALLCGEKLNQRLGMWRKMTNVRYDQREVK